MLIFQYQAERNPVLLGEIWEKYKLLVYKIANSYAGKAELEDLEQEGFIALCNATEVYDSRYNVPFSNYVALWVSWYLRRYISNNGAVHVPIRRRQQYQKYKNLCSEFERDFNRQPTEREVMRLLGVGKKELEAIEKAVSVASLNVSTGPEEEDAELLEMIGAGEDFTEESDRAADRERMQRELWAAVDELPADRAELIRKRYKDGMQLKEIAESAQKNYNTVNSTLRDSLNALRRKKTCQWYYEDYFNSRRVSFKSFMRTHTSEQELYILDHYY